MGRPAGHFNAHGGSGNTAHYATELPTFEMPFARTYESTNRATEPPTIEATKFAAVKVAVIGTK